MPHTREMSRTLCSCTERNRLAKLAFEECGILNNILRSVRKCVKCPAYSYTADRDLHAAARNILCCAPLIPARYFFSGESLRRLRVLALLIYIKAATFNGD